MFMSHVPFKRQASHSSTASQSYLSRISLTPTLTTYPLPNHTSLSSPPYQAWKKIILLASPSSPHPTCSLSSPHPSSSTTNNQPNHQRINRRQALLSTLCSAHLPQRVIFTNIHLQKFLLCCFCRWYSCEVDMWLAEWGKAEGSGPWRIE